MGTLLVEFNEGEHSFPDRFDEGDFRGQFHKSRQLRNIRGGARANECRHQRVLVWEVLVKRANADTGQVCNLVRCHAVDRATGENASRRSH